MSCLPLILNEENLLTAGIKGLRKANLLISKLRPGNHDLDKLSCSETLIFTWDVPLEWIEDLDHRIMDQSKINNMIKWNI